MAAENNGPRGVAIEAMKEKGLAKADGHRRNISKSRKSPWGRCPRIWENARNAGVLKVENS